MPAQATIISALRRKCYLEVEKSLPDSIEPGGSTGFGGLQLAQGGEHLLDMAGDLHLAPDAPQHAFAINQEGRAVDPHIFAAIHGFLDPGAIGLRRLAGGVREQRDLQPMLVDEAIMARDIIISEAE